MSACPLRSLSSSGDDPMLIEPLPVSQSPHDTRRSLRTRSAQLSDKSSLRFRPLPVSLHTRSKSTPRGDSLRKQVHKQSTSLVLPTLHPDRDIRVRDLKKRALAIPSTGKTPATLRQRMVMQMVYDEITPYPDEAWVSQLGIVIQREYHQVKNWFSNQRQKDARDSRQSPQPSSSSNPESSLCKITCDGREMRIRTSALDVCSADEWSDAFFDEVIMIHNFRLLAKQSQDDARAALLDSPLGTTDLSHTSESLSSESSPLS